VDHNPYQAPMAATDPPAYGQASFDELVAATNPTMIVRVAAAFTAVLGAMVALAGLQFVGAVAPIVVWVPYAMMGSGAATIFAAVRLFQTRGWAAIGAAVWGVVVTLGMGLWVVLTLASGVVSFLAALTLLVAPATAVLAILSVGPCRLAGRARAQLRLELCDEPPLPGASDCP
jgi:hypothetical protein